MDIDTLHGLSLCPLFKGLSQEEVMTLMHTVRYRLVHIARGEILAMAGDVCQKMDIVIRGELSATLSTPSGRVVRMGLHHAGNVVAPAFAFAADNSYPVTVEALTDTIVCRLMVQDMQTLLEADRRICMNYIRLVSNIVAFLTRKMSMLSMTVREKICHYLKEECKRQKSHQIKLEMSRQQLAEHFGIQKYSLQRCLAELQQERMIEIQGKRVIVHHL